MGFAVRRAASSGPFIIFDDDVDLSSIDATVLIYFEVAISTPLMADCPKLKSWPSKIAKITDLYRAAIR